MGSQMRILFGTLSATLLCMLACAATADTLLVLNKSDNTVSFLDLTSKKSVATLPTGSGPHEVAVSRWPHSNRL